MSERKFKEVDAEVYMAGPPSLIVVSWEFYESVIPLARYEMSIYRGESPEELTLLASGIRADMFSQYEDRTARLFDIHRTYHYKVVAKNKETSKEVLSDIFTWEGKLDLTAQYIIEEHHHLFDYCIGIPVYIYKKQTEGDARCHNCWDKVAKRITKSSCTTCHGTGLVGRGVGGYYNPSYVWVDFQPDPEILQITQWGRTQPTQTDIFMNNFPRMTPGDLLIELTTDKRWKVMQVRDSEKRRTKLLQIVRLDLLTKDEVEYKIEVPAEIRRKARREINDRKNGPEF